MLISVLIPTLDEQDELPGCLASVRAQRPPAHEILVADGGSSDRTLALAAGATVLVADCGRGRQLNAASRRASGEVLLFLHADSRLPAGALAAVEACLADPANVGGAFHKRFRSDSPWLRGVRWRTRLWHRFGAVFGDQALFARSADFRALGGFREDLVAEDAEFARRLARRGRLALLDPEVETSARRLEREGAFRTWARWWWIWGVERARGLGAAGLEGRPGAD